MKRWTIADGESPRVYLINDGRDAVGEIIYTETRRPEDARLIAAAPDLLKALIDLLDEADIAEVDEYTAPKIDAARAAIAKAEGVRS